MFLKITPTTTSLSYLHQVGITTVFVRVVILGAFLSCKTTNGVTVRPGVHHSLTTRLLLKSRLFRLLTLPFRLLTLLMMSLILGYRSILACDHV